MKIIGITGLIGSGKSIVMKIFNCLYDTPIYDCDNKAKEVYYLPYVRKAIIRDLGVDPIKNDGSLDKEKLRTVLRNHNLRGILELIIHRALSDDLKEWLSNQNNDIVIIESAILFTSNFNKFCDYIIRVAADNDIRERRVLLRDTGMTPIRYKEIVRIQGDEEREQMKRSNYIVDNSGQLSLVTQVETIYKDLSHIISEQ